MLELVKNRDKPVFFIDESMYTVNQTTSSTWWFKGKDPPTVQRNALAFYGISVIAAIDVKGKLVHTHIKQGAVNADDFNEFLDGLADKTNLKPCALYLDNLRAHHTAEVKENAFYSQQELVFAGSYSSELNPIEALWCWSKPQFRKIIT